MRHDTSTHRQPGPRRELSTHRFSKRTLPAFLILTAASAAILTVGLGVASAPTSSELSSADRAAAITEAPVTQPTFSDATPLSTARGYDLSVVDASGPVGKTLTVLVEVAAHDGFKCNEKYPSKIKELSGSGVDFPAGTTVAGNVKDGTLAFQVPVTPTTAGPHQVQGTARFSVCSDSSCYIEKVEINAKVTGR